MANGQARGIRQDMFGLVDVLCLWPDRTDFIQCCGVDVASHLTKITSSVDLKARLAAILADPNRRFFLICWRERQLKGQARPEWVIRVIEIFSDTSTRECSPDEYIAGTKIIAPNVLAI